MTQWNDHILVEDYYKNKNFKKTVELMPDDPIVNDHYGDILTKLNRKYKQIFLGEVLKWRY